ncbi:Uncharacterised protein [Bordetella pertussis]|nr:Uncharacterised protein [Bordetella pertussis]
MRDRTWLPTFCIDGDCAEQGRLRPFVLTQRQLALGRAQHGIRGIWIEREDQRIDIARLVGTVGLLQA